MLRLEPVPPDQPHRLMAPEELSTALEVADALNGELPHWHRGRSDRELEGASEVPCRRRQADFD